MNGSHRTPLDSGSHSASRPTEAHASRVTPTSHGTTVISDRSAPRRSTPQASARANGCGRTHPTSGRTEPPDVGLADSLVGDLEGPVNDVEAFGQLLFGDDQRR